MREQPLFRRRYDLSKMVMGSVVIGYVLLLILLPIGQLVHSTFGQGWSGFQRALLNPSALFSMKLTITLALLTAVINTVAGTISAYVLVRYPLPGKKILNAMVDLPFAIPTAVSGLMLLVMFGPKSILGGALQAKGIEVVYAPPGIVLAMIFVTFPFVIRSVQPILEDMGVEMVEAAKILGAGRWQTFFRVVLPTILPGILSGFTLTFSRALAEFGSVVMVAGNIPYKTQTAAVFIYGEIESGNLNNAGTVSLLLLILSFLLLFYQNYLLNRQRFGWWQRLLAKAGMGRKGKNSEFENWAI
ncbi:sulfate ABC transporter permease subunit CysT [Heliobacterium mobile]|nr:sulfate ABC transporter permease subunit CysT [Heliobacterium mobile]